MPYENYETKEINLGGLASTTRNSDLAKTKSAPRLQVIVEQLDKMSGETEKLVEDVKNRVSNIHRVIDEVDTDDRILDKERPPQDALSQIEMQLARIQKSLSKLYQVNKQLSEIV